MTPTRTPTEVVLEVLYLDAQTCDPCRATTDAVDVAATALTEHLRGEGRTLIVRKVHVTDPGQAHALGFVSSPTVRVDGVDIELDVQEASCATCSSLAARPVNCRTFEWQGMRHPAPPAEMIVHRVLEHLAGTLPDAAAAEDRGASSVDRFLAARSGPAPEAATTRSRFDTGPQPVALPPVPVVELRARVTGRVSTPVDPSYADAVTPWQLAIPVRPRIAVEATSAQDVVETVRFARRHGLTVTPQATGHGPISALVGDILVTTSGLDECVVHAEGWARVGAGVKWLRVVEEAAPHGLAPLSGSITDVGVVGYTTGGGLGPMARTYGLASDRVRAFEVVTGDGELRRVTPTEHPELYFGLRGGKGTLGIVTAVEFDLVRQPDFYGGALWFDGADAAAVTERWRTWSATLPEAGTTSIALFRLPPLPGVPEPLAGRLTVSVRYVWTGSAEDGERQLAGLRAAAPLLVDDVRVKPYAEIDSVHTDPLDPMPVHEYAVLLGDFPATAAAALVAAAGPGSPSQEFLVEVRQLGVAYARGGEQPSAFCPRHASYSVLAVGLPGVETDRDQAVLARALAPWALPDRLPNFSFTPEQLAAAYTPAVRARLLAALDTYDPDGVLAVSQALRSSTWPSEAPAARRRAG